MHYENHICLKCSKIFPNIDRLNRHLYTHSATRKKFDCSHCSVVSTSVLIKSSEKILYFNNYIY